MKTVGRGMNANAKNVYNRTALHYAVAGKNKEAVQLLLQRRVKVDQKDKHGITPIHLAAWFGSLDILKLLVQAGAEQKVENEDGLNIMHCAAMNNHTDIVEYIISDLQMKELDKEDQSGNRAFAQAAKNGCVEMLEMLMDTYDMATMKGDTPLHLAARNGHLDAVQLLLQSFDTRDEVNMDGETALYQAADHGHEECVRALLEAGCNPDIVTVLDPCTTLYCSMNFQRSQTAMHLAAEVARIEVVEMLLKSRVDLTLKDRQDKTVLGVAARANEVIIVDMIIKAERYYAWREANPELNESVPSEYPLTFKLDHRNETKQLRSMAWRLAYELLKPGDWKRLAGHWGFTKDQISAIEEQWTGEHSYREHGNRMLLIWLHGEELAQRSPAKDLYHGLIVTRNRKAADKIRMEEESSSNKGCCVS
uniref:Ankyrin repeat and death domain containing 1B n=1 Tax=Salarias fasciatus TaxID=181472 RepID=A0A672GS47_SALFA